MAERLTDEQLVALMDDALEKAPSGSRWKHRKGGVYRVTDVALTSDDLTPVIVYRNVAKLRPTFTREAAEFLDGRFTRID